MSSPSSLTSTPDAAGRLSRAQGCLLGQLAGDALGSLVEFQGPETIKRKYPAGVREMHDGGTYNTIAGQPTDDSEMALALARTLVADGRFDPDHVLAAYRAWKTSGPFDIGGTTSRGLAGNHDHCSQANGAMMRISPLAIFGAGRADLEQVTAWARADAALTHPNPVCQSANALYAMAIAHAIQTGPTPTDLYDQIVAWAGTPDTPSLLQHAIDEARSAPPADFMRQQGWVLIAFPNALYQLVNAPSLEAGIVDTIGRGGDTDTNAAIAGALFGAVHGRDAVPARWVDTLRSCRPRAGAPGVYQPRPETYWPTDALDLAAALLGQPPA